ncbi:hypothetical protein D8M04_11595 [Oceanobacillus piezotolerans]|uniref:Lipoprotein n=1 Tax=Oceanobacillus piezotolerans TaxID=2448030 RepID=A0A498DCL0_9BACI|nr:DUF6376 family protein [Oceanobacillus piezotolerans]RLL45483.1 hypothetical protein D8M04_11595 [Oceanobacillus piezotolerans]
MKRIMILLVFSIALTGCSFFEETNDTLNYATQATEYFNDLSNFAEETSGLMNQAASDPAAKEELETQLLAIEKSIIEFNEMDAPAIADGLHQNLLEKNQQLLDITENVVQNGEVALEELQYSEIYQTIENITELKTQIEELGF